MSKEPKHWKISPKARIIPRSEMRQYPKEAFEPRNTKVRITMYVDADVLGVFKARAAKGGLPYQTLINAELRRIVESEEQPDNPESLTSKLKQARTLIDTALRASRK